MTAKGRTDRIRNEDRKAAHHHLLVAAALAVALAVFAFDLLSNLDGAIAVLQIATILLVAPLGRRFVVAAGCGAALLAAIAFVAGHAGHISEGALSRFGVSLIAILITTLLSLRDRSSRTTLSEQARLLELSHDTVVIRDPHDAIVYWNDGAEELYGWTREEAIGRRCSELLQCVFPRQEVDAALAREGQWSGEIKRTRRDGTQIVLASRWLLRRDPEGRAVGVIESSADMTEQLRADAEREVSERRFRTIFETAGFAAWESDWTEAMRIGLEGAPRDETLEAWLVDRPDRIQQGTAAAVIRNANQAAADLFDVASREDLVGANLCGRYAPDGLAAFAHIVSRLVRGETSVDAETRLVTLSGRIADIVLRVSVLPEGKDWSHMLVMAYDVTERNEARTRLEQMSAELAHAGRVSMLGQLAASIAHEVNQPLTAIVNYGKSGGRWLNRPEPDLGEVQACLDKIVAGASRAAAVIDRVRGLARKAAPQSDALDLAELADDAIAFVQSEARSARVAIRRDLRPAPAVTGDRVQVQQVLVNLLMNGIQAMRDTTDRPRELTIRVEPQTDATVRVAVRDRGTGFAPDGAARLFEPFFTTKSDGMGMGLSICRSIIEAQGGSISAANNEGPGATVAFTLPVAGREAGDAGGKAGSPGETPYLNMI